MKCDASEWGIVNRPCTKRATWVVTLPDGETWYRCTEHKDRAMRYQAKRGAVAAKVGV